MLKLRITFLCRSSTLSEFTKWVRAKYLGFDLKQNESFIGEWMLYTKSICCSKKNKYTLGGEATKKGKSIFQFLRTIFFFSRMQLMYWIKKEKMNQEMRKWYIIPWCWTLFLRPKYLHHWMASLLRNINIGMDFSGFGPPHKNINEHRDEKKNPTQTSNSQV